MHKIDPTRISKRANVLRRIAKVISWTEIDQTPEWGALKKAWQSRNLKVFAVGLEVLVSHYAEKFSAGQKFALRALAQNLRSQTMDPGFWTRKPVEV